LRPEGAERSDEEPAILDKLRRGEVIDHFRTVRRTKSGADIDVSVNLSPIKDAAGNIIGISKIVRDITARLQLSKELARSRQLAQATLDGLTANVCLLDQQARIVAVNRGLARFRAGQRRRAGADRRRRE
jgi:PAS domain-containing protein